MLSVISTAEKDALISRRAGEIKLGEHVVCCDNPDNFPEVLAAFRGRYVLLGIPEDIGVRANLGVGGAHTYWKAALTALLNIQSTEKLSGEGILLAGSVAVHDLMDRAETADTPTLRALTAELDERVAPIIKAIAAAGKVPVVVGGGHNNAFPIIKGIAEGFGVSVNTLNIDAHSDFRVCEGRHSGNGFRYAKEAGALKKYAVFGLHEQYNSQAVLNDLRANDECHISFWEDIFLRRTNTFETALTQAIAHVADAPCGLELDVDCIAGVLSSARTAVGISAAEAAYAVFESALRLKPVYFHLTEGATALRSGQIDATAGKTAAYMLAAFMKGSAGAKN